MAKINFPIKQTALERSVYRNSDGIYFIFHFAKSILNPFYRLASAISLSARQRIWGMIENPNAEGRKITMTERTANYIRLFAQYGAREMRNDRCHGFPRRIVGFLLLCREAASQVRWNSSRFFHSPLSRKVERKVPFNWKLCQGYSAKYIFLLNSIKLIVLTYRHSFTRCTLSSFLFQWFFSLLLPS